MIKALYVMLMAMGHRGGGGGGEAAHINRDKLGNENQERNSPNLLIPLFFILGSCDKLHTRD
jgi:hypothetical protein